MEVIQCILNVLGDNVEALIALSALGLAIWQGMTQRQHNRLSVKPHLVFERVVNNNSPQLQIFLTNTGVGPAIIKHFFVSLDGVTVDFPMEKIWLKIAENLNISGIWGGGKSFQPGDAIEAGGKNRIFALKTTNDEMDPSFISEVAYKELDRIQIEVEYESVYGVEFVEKLNKA